MGKYPWVRIHNNNKNFVCNLKLSQLNFIMHKVVEFTIETNI